MTPRSFIADSAVEAVNQIRSELGPDAVVIHVRKLQPDGISRLWQKARIEVLAYKPEPAAETLPKPADSSPLSAEPFSSTFTAPQPGPEARSFDKEPWKTAAFLQESGILPAHVQKVLDDLKGRHGDRPPAQLGEELSLVRDSLKSFWKPLRSGAIAGPQPHILIGPAGVGKSVVLAKWLTQTVLIEGGDARIWRLDGLTANTAESLSVYSEILGLDPQRQWSGQAAKDVQAAQFIDLPGISWQSKSALTELEGLLRQFGMPRLHLVLNAAYELPILMAQARAFSSFPLEDLILTHMDEETRGGKLWNLVLGTNFPIRFTSAGQNIPGGLLTASADALIGRLFGSKA